jgi:hypothetical protein
MGRFHPLMSMPSVDTGAACVAAQNKIEPINHTTLECKTVN